MKIMYVLMIVLITLGCSSTTKIKTAKCNFINNTGSHLSLVINHGEEILIASNTRYTYQTVGDEVSFRYSISGDFINPVTDVVTYTSYDENNLVYVPQRGYVKIINNSAGFLYTSITGYNYYNIQPLSTKYYYYSEYRAINLYYQGNYVWPDSSKFNLNINQGRVFTIEPDCCEVIVRNDTQYPITQISMTWRYGTHSCYPGSSPWYTTNDLTDMFGSSVLSPGNNLYYICGSTPSGYCWDIHASNPPRYYAIHNLQTTINQTTEVNLSDGVIRITKPIENYFKHIVKRTL